MSWNRVETQVRPLVLERSGAEVIWVNMAEDMGEHPGFYIPEDASVNFGTDMIFGEGTKPRQVELVGINTLDGQERWPEAMGVIAHEAYHVRFSSEEFLITLNDPEVLNERAAQIGIMLEEQHIEHHGVRLFPQDQPFLRASALNIIFQETLTKIAEMEQKEADGEEVTAPRVTGIQTYILCAPRVASGILERTDVTPILSLVETVVDEESRNLIDDAVIEYNNAVNDTAEKVRIIRELEANLPKDKTEQQDEASKEAAKQLAEALANAMQAMGDRVADQVREDAIEIEPEPEDPDEDKRTEAQKETQEAKAEQFFEQKQTGVGPDTNYQKSSSRLIQQRQPTGNEIRMANEIADELRRARFRDRDKTRVQSEVPPGRLNMSAAMQKRANPSGTAYRFSDVQRKRIEHPKLKLALLGDVSGSMSQAMEPLGVAQYVFANAVRQIEGTAAAVYFGYSAFPVLAPGEERDTVDIWSAPDGGHQFSDAFDAADNAMGLTYGDGARMVVMFTDAYHESNQTKAEREKLGRFIRRGGAVVVMDLSGSDEAQKLCKHVGATYLPITGNIEEAARLIGVACREALEESAPTA